MGFWEEMFQFYFAQIASGSTVMTQLDEYGMARKRKITSIYERIRNKTIHIVAN